MKGEEKLCHYLERAFYGIRQTKEIQEEKEALLAELTKKYQALLEQGYEPENAYQTVISGIGDIFELVDGIVGNMDSEHSWEREKTMADQTPEAKNLTCQPYSNFYKVLPYAVAGIFFLLWLWELIFPAGPKEQMILPLLLLGAALGSAALWLVLRAPELSSIKEIPAVCLLKAAVYCIAAILFFRAATKPHLVKNMWLIPLGALAISQLISVWTAFQKEKKRGGHDE